MSSSKLKYLRLRELESALGVFLEEISPNHTRPHQRFNVYNSSPEEKFLGEVMAKNLFFDYQELLKKIIKLT